VFLLSCGAGTIPLPTETSIITNGCESINLYPTNNEQWSSLCFCTETDEEFTQCIDDWVVWNKHS